MTLSPAWQVTLFLFQFIANNERHDFRFVHFLFLGSSFLHSYVDTHVTVFFYFVRQNGRMVGILFPPSTAVVSIQYRHRRDSLSWVNYSDWGHAKDYIKGMWLMVQRDEPSDYVLSTGECHSVKEFVQEVRNCHRVHRRYQYLDVSVCLSVYVGRIGLGTQKQRHSKNIGLLC